MENKQKKKQKEQKHPIVKTNRTINQQNSRNYYDLLGIAFIIILGIIIYSNSFKCSFHFDDTGSIVDNPAIRNLSDIKSIWNYSNNRFVAYFSFALNYHFGKLDVWGYHLMNLMIHLITSIIVWWLTVLIFSTPAMKDKEISKNKKMIALFTSLLFVSHPLATQSVTYIVQRLASMVAMFYLLSLALYVKARLLDKRNLSKYMLFASALISAVLALLTKENAYTLPFAIVLFEIFFLQTKKIKIGLKDYRVLLIIIGFVGIIGLVFFKFSFSIFNAIPPNHGNIYTITLENYLFTQFSVIIKYLQLLILPINQNIDYDFPISNSFFEIRTLFSFVGLLSLLLCAVYLFKKHRIISFAIFWFFLTLLIESSIIPIEDVIYEHRTYLPSFGFFLIMTSVIYLLRQKHRFVSISRLIIFIISNSFLTIERNKIWKDELTLSNDIVSKSPHKARPIVSRGVYYSNLGQWETAIFDYTKGIEINPRYIEAYNLRGNAYHQLGQLDKAIADNTKALEIDVNYVQGYYNRGLFYSEDRQLEKAIIDYSKAIEINQKYKEAYNLRGVAFYQLGQLDKAIADYSKAIEIDTRFTIALYNRGIVYENNKQFDKAIFDYSEAIVSDPKYSRAYSSRGIVYFKLELWSKAIEDLSKAIGFDSKNSSLYFNRANSYLKSNNYNMALNDYSKAIEIEPKFVQAYFNRGNVYFKLQQWKKAIEDYSKAIEIEPNFKEAYDNRNIAFQKLQQKEMPLVNK